MGDVTSDMALIKMFCFHNKQRELLQNWLQPQLIRYDASVYADAPD